MIHHSSTEYAVATSQAAKVGRDKMEAVINKGRASALAVLEKVQSEVPQDRIAMANRLAVVSNNRGANAQPVGFDLVWPDKTQTRLHDHALVQVAEKSGIYNKFLSDLTGHGQWGYDLAAHNINELLLHTGSRHLIRTVTDSHGPQVRGFLSDRFRRLDSRPLLDAFTSAVQKIGALPLEGFAQDTRVKMRAVLPMVFEPIKDEVMIFGAEWGNSDFGNGGHYLDFWIMRTYCTNLAVGDSVLRQVHLGKRLEDNINYSQRTYQLDTEANASALQDVVADTLSPNSINGYLEHIKTLAEEEVQGKDIAGVLKQKLNKGELEQVQDLFNGNDVVNLPPGNNKYRLSNAISWLAQSKDVSENRKLELQSVAGSLMPRLNIKTKEV